MSRSLLVLPDDSAKPILDAIRTATKSISVKMFVFSDPALLEAVVAACRRGVKVRVMLNPARRSGEEDNEETRGKLTRAGIDVVDGNPAFDLTHEKSMVVDEKIAFVKSLNWATKNLTETRDYAVVTSHLSDVGEIVECFEADWHRKPFASERARLIWCPGGRDRICRFIEEARHTLFVQNERYQDVVVIECLVRAARRGVKLHLMTRPPHTLKKDKLVEGVGGLRIMDDVGIKIHKLKKLKLHGKMLLADGTAASWRSRCGTTRWWRGSTRSPNTTGSIRTLSISPTTGCSPTCRTAAGTRKFAPSSTSRRRRRTKAELSGRDPASNRGRNAAHGARITVSGFTKTSTSDHLVHTLRKVTHNNRSAPVRRPRRPVWARTASCCRRARFSITRSVRE